MSPKYRHPYETLCRLVEKKVWIVYVTFGMFAIGARLFPYLVRHHDIPIDPHDNLDGAVASLKLLVESGKLFADTFDVIPNAMGTMPRVSLGPALQLDRLYYSLFSPFTAYTVNLFLVHLIAFIGAILVCKDYILRIEHRFSSILIAVTAANFALLPFWPHAMIGVSGIPLQVWCFANLWVGRYKKLSFTLLLIVPFYSSLWLPGVFTCSLLMVAGLYGLIFRSIRLPLIAVISMIALYSGIEWRMFEAALFNDNVVFHRVEHSFSKVNFHEAWKQTKINFIWGQYHAASHHLPTLVAAFSIVLFSFYRRTTDYRLAFALMSCFAASLIYGFTFWTGLDWLRSLVPILNAFNISRYHWLHPFLWMLVLCLSIDFCLKHLTRGFACALAILVAQIVFSFARSEIPMSYGEGVSFRQFYGEKLHQNVADYIGEEKSTYRILSVGAHPAVAIYNGFYTLDGYSGFYPLSYKKIFYKMMESEFAKNSVLKDYYLTWGNRAYAFSAEIGQRVERLPQGGVIQQILINAELFKSLGGRFVFSRHPIVDFPGFGLVRHFESATDKIFLYEVL